MARKQNIIKKQFLAKYLISFGKEKLFPTFYPNFTTPNIDTNTPFTFTSYSLFLAIAINRQAL
jgi:hypothetical protein